MLGELNWSLPQTRMPVETQVLFLRTIKHGVFPNINYHRIDLIFMV